VTEYRLLSEPSADLDVEAAFDWYEDERPGLGMEFLGELRAAYNRIAGGPHGYQDLRLGIRRALLRRFPYAVYFAVDGDVVVVIAVLHASRDPAEWQRRRGESDA
jgi:plasmid stabilization system protein ParE